MWGNLQIDVEAHYSSCCPSSLCKDTSKKSTAFRCTQEHPHNPTSSLPSNTRTQQHPPSSKLTVKLPSLHWNEHYPHQDQRQHHHPPQRGANHHIPKPDCVESTRHGMHVRMQVQQATQVVSRL